MKTITGQTVQRIGLGCGIGVTVLLIGCVIALAVLGPQLIDRLVQQGEILDTVALTEMDTSQLAAHRDAELARLNNYGWVNEDDGVAHIPIERAIALVAEDGLPVGLEAAGVDATNGADAAALEDVDLENVSFSEDILPIFKDRCSECHEWPDPSEDLVLTSYGDVMYGSANGDVVIPGEPENSYLVELIETGQMPRRRDPLTTVQIELIKAWIEAGALDN